MLDIHDLNLDLNAQLKLTDDLQLYLFIGRVCLMPYIVEHASSSLNGFGRLVFVALLENQLFSDHEEILGILLVGFW